MIIQIYCYANSLNRRPVQNTVYFRRIHFQFRTTTRLDSRALTFHWSRSRTSSVRRIACNGSHAHTHLFIHDLLHKPPLMCAYVCWRCSHASSMQSVCASAFHIHFERTFRSDQRVAIISDRTRPQRIIYLRTGGGIMK